MLLPVNCYAAGAENYPSRPVRLVVPFAPGGGLDILARLLGQKFTESMRAPDVRDVLVREGSEPFGSTPAYLAEYFSTELASVVSSK